MFYKDNLKDLLGEELWGNKLITFKGMEVDRRIRILRAPVGLRHVNWNSTLYNTSIYTFGLSVWHICPLEYRNKAVFIIK